MRNKSALERNNGSSSQTVEVASNVALLPKVLPPAPNFDSIDGNDLKRVNALKKHPYNYHMKQRPSSGLIWNQSSRKNILSHNQVLCLVQHALDPLDVPMFITSVETIKSSNGQFPNVVPLSVRKEIYEKFCISSSRVDVVDMYDSDHVKVSPMVVQAVGKTATNESNDFQMLGKTPVWAIAHCLERIGSD